MLIRNLPHETKRKLTRIGFKESDSIDKNYEGIGDALFGFYIIAPLHYAAKIGDFELVKSLLENGASIDLRDDTHGLTPLMWASYYGRDKIVKYLLQKDADATLEGKIPSLPKSNAYELTKRYSICSFTNLWYTAQKYLGNSNIDKTRSILEAHRRKLK